ncbi:hypothetical protein VMCG_01796 [Cytospora schulzeri]|uniref:Nuclear pore protein n=1 Tax=Cytospora schulzeri TaxID=448051 RepID=A0A423X3H0_9PEZI|nr:hypothetical protein VMCG_01796 [Valsa malicola]
MLYGGFAESKPSNKGQEWVVALPADDPISLATILYIIHNKFSKVPDAVTRGELYRLTILTDKYDMTEVLRPWARAWVGPLASKSRPLGQKGDEALLWIAWELGHSSLFERTLRHVQETCIVDPKGKLLDSHGVCLADNDHMKALDIIDGTNGLLARRASRIQSLLWVMDIKVRTLATGREAVFSSRCEREHLDSCNIWYLGSLIRSLARAGYYPVPLSVSIRCSVREFRTKLGSVCDDIRKNPISLTTCSPASELRLLLAAVGTSIELTNAQRKRLQQQAAKTGLQLQDP